MKPIKIIAALLVFAIICFSTIILYEKFFVSQKKEFFKTDAPQKRNISQTIYSTGKLEIKGIIKIGSLVAGTIKKIYVQENDKVKKGQLLTKIDNGKEDTTVRMAQGDLIKAQADLAYEEKYYQRQKALFEQKQISKDFFDQVSRDYEKAQAEVTTKKAALEKEQIEYNNTQVYSPEDGIIVSVGITEGMKITTDLDATVLFRIATDITKMEATIDIDENDIGYIKKGQKAKFNVGTYMDKIFHGIITNVSYAAQTKNGIFSYQAKIEVDNKDLMLRPGMTVNAKINVAKAKNCLSISSQAFQINSKALEKIARHLKFNFVPIEKEKVKELKKISSSFTNKYVWIFYDHTFKEKAIQVSVTDDNYFEIKAGITEQDQVVVDTKEEDEMTALYEKMFKGAL